MNQAHCAKHDFYYNADVWCPECVRERLVGGVGNKTPVPTTGDRSEVKPFYSAIPFRSLRRVALRATGAIRGSVYRDGESGFDYEGGSRKYGYGNWERGLELEDTYNHILEHLGHWYDAIRQGQRPNDDDLSAAAWGILMPLMTFERLYEKQCADRAAAIAAGMSAEDVDADGDKRNPKRLIKRLSPESPVAPSSGREIK